MSDDIPHPIYHVDKAEVFSLLSIQRFLYWLLFQLLKKGEGISGL